MERAWCNELTNDIELLMLLGDKVVKIYEKDKEIKRLNNIIGLQHDEITRLNEILNGRLESSSIK